MRGEGTRATERVSCVREGVNSAVHPFQMGARVASSAPQYTPRQPRGATSIERLDDGTLEHRHVELDRVADALLDVGKVAVALGQCGHRASIELQRRTWVDRVDAVLLVDRLPVQQLPLSLVLDHEVVEATDAHH